ncbi:ABC transporter permease [Butyrivibrio sp. CB08]|nr:ABC transporter permease [Butyrivibrio sp. CB08]
MGRNQGVLMGNKKKISKGIALGAFYALALVLALLLIFHNNPLEDADTAMLKKICGCVLIGISCILVFIWYDRLLILPVELFHSRKLIKRLAVNDFKKRYAGSYMGIVWALAQPVVTVCMYYIVFDRVFQSRAQAVSDGVVVPYVLFLTAGLVPWFFFSEALTNGTTSLLEYNYLVKKVLFKISILPIIKIIAAMFIHVFFTCVLMIIACIYGYYPSIYWLQLIYYIGCEFILVLSISYATSAIVVFFRDLLQIISIGLQLFQWATPILWNIDIVPDKYKWIVKLNPMSYIVEGFRNTIYGESWFFEHFYSSTYFWIFVVAVFCIGTLIFKRSKTHFADVL